ncbi:MAG TPA: hypothetical protein VFR41_15555 [Acidimicrobiia bacterium]|nr:hypothetical protein [Acidimicrobiia bacterium]
MKNRRRVRAVVGGALIACMLAACSSSGGTTAPKTTTTALAPSTIGGKPPSDPCQFFTKAEIATLFRQTGFSMRAANVLNGARSCAIGLDKDNLVHSLVVTAAAGTQTYGEKIIPNARPLAGLGDKAYVAARSIANALIISFIVRGNTYTISYSGGGFAGKHFDPNTQQDELTNLVKTAAARLK